MKKRILIIVLLFVLLGASFPVTTAWLLDSTEKTVGVKSYVHKSYFESGDGTSVVQYAGSDLSSDEGCAFEIKYPVQLYYFAWLQYLGYFNQSENGSTIKQMYFYLSSDLNMYDEETNTQWVLPPIGTETFPFLGNFDGNGHTISNLVVQNVATSTASPTTISDAPEALGTVEIVGLFGVVGSLSTKGTANASYESGGDFLSTSGYSYTYQAGNNEIKNFNLSNVTLKAEANTNKTLVGAVAGYLNANVSHVSVEEAYLSVVNGLSSVSGLTNISDYSVIGYNADELSSSNVTSIGLAVPTIDSSNTLATAYSGSTGQGEDWGGSINMLSLFNRLDYIRSEYYNIYSGANTTNGYIERIQGANPSTDSYAFYNDPSAQHIIYLTDSSTSSGITYTVSNETEAVYDISCNGEYLNVNDTFDGVEGGSGSNNQWHLGSNGYLYTTVNRSYGDYTRQVVLYLNLSEGILVLGRTASTTWGQTNGNIYPTSDTSIFLTYDNGWKVQGNTAPKIRIYQDGNTSYYLNINSTNNGVTRGTTPTDWYAELIPSTSYYYVYCIIDGVKYYLTQPSSSSVGITAESSFVKGNYAGRRWLLSSMTDGVVVARNNSYKINYSSSKWQVSTTSSNNAKIKVIQQSQAVPKTTMTQHGTGNIVTYATTSNATTGTSFPINAASGSITPSVSNPGYFNAGYDTSGRGSIRVSRYSVYKGSNQFKDLSGSVSGTEGNYTVGTVYTPSNNMTTPGFTTIGSNTAAFTNQYYDKEEDGETKEGIGNIFLSLLNSGGGYIYGLHFTNSSIDTSNITFNVREKGAITFMAGTYYNSTAANTAFFSLYHEDNGTYKEVEAIYEVGNTYEYKYKNEAYSGGGTKIFDCSLLVNPSSIQMECLYYFEIPVVAGNYRLGSVDGKDGAYMMYLDISASGDNNSVVVPGTSIVETEVVTTYNYEYLPGINIKSTNSTYDAVLSEKIASPTTSLVTKDLTYDDMTKDSKFILPYSDTISDKLVVANYLGKTEVITQKTTMTGTVDNVNTTIVVTKTTTRVYNASNAVTSTTNTISATMNGTDMQAIPTGFAQSDLVLPNLVVEVHYYDSGGVTISTSTDASVSNNALSVSTYSINLTYSGELIVKVDSVPSGKTVNVNNVSVSANDILGFGSLSNDLTSATLNGSSTSFKKIGTSYYYVKSDATSAGSSIYTISNGVATIVSNGSYRGS